ncbi:MAG: hypothetical protein QXI19_13315 [Candidatus Caldarchaeum sp.]
MPLYNLLACVADANGREWGMRGSWIEWDEHRFVVHANGARYGSSWEAIKRIVAYKQDLITIDRVCLEIHLMDGAVVTAHEDMDNFWDWVSALEQQLGIAEGWRKEVLYPAFDKNEILIYDKD